MTSDQSQVLAELPLPLGPDAGVRDALAVAVAVEDGCGVTLTDDLITVANLGSRTSIESVLHTVSGPL